LRRGVAPGRGPRAIAAQERQHERHAATMPRWNVETVDGVGASEATHAVERLVDAGAALCRPRQEVQVRWRC
jgi:hypothetical protein